MIRKMQVRPWHLALLAALIGGVAHAIWYAGPFEDAFITFRYAENWAGGHGLRFNPGGEMVEGFSSLSWVSLMAAVSALGIDVPAFAETAGVAFAVLLLGLAAISAIRLGGARSMGIAFVPALIAITGTFGYWAGSGTETTLFAALIAFVVLGAGSEERRDHLIAGLCLAVAIATRPEAIAYAIAVIFALAATRRWRAALVVSVPAIVAAAAITIWRMATFGELLPNTFYARAEPSLALWGRGAAYVEAMMTSHLLWLVVPAAVIVLASSEQRRRLGPAVAVIAAAIAGSIAAGGDGFLFYRFMLPALAPIGLVLVAAGGAVSRGWSRPARALGGSLAASTLLGLAAIASSGGSWSLSDKGRADERETVERAARINHDYFAVGRFLRDELDPDTVIAVNATGIVPYVSGLTTIDMLGLTDRHIAHLEIELGHGPAGHEKHDAEYVLSREPDIIIIGLPVLVSRPPAGDAELLEYLHRRSEHIPGDRALLASRELAERYRPWVAHIGGRYLIVFARDERVAPAERSAGSLVGPEHLAALIKGPSEPQWFGVYLGERKIGHARLGLRASGAGEPPSIVAESSMSIPMSDDPKRRVEIVSDRYYHRQPPHRLVEVRVRETTDKGTSTIRYASGPAGMRVFRTIDGRERRGRRVPASSETLATLVAQYLLEPEAVAAGDRQTFHELDVDRGRDREVSVEVAARRTQLVFGVTTEVAELAIRQAGDQTVTRTLIAAGGRTLRATVGRFSFRAQDRRRATSGVDGFDHLANVVAVDRRLGDPARIVSMAAVLESDAEFLPPAAANQRVSREGDRLRLTITAGPGDPVSEKERAGALAVTAEIDASDPAIQKLAAELAAGVDDPRARVERLVRRVNEGLVKRTSTHLASASQVLAEGAGDCTEHTLLFVALARAMGLPAREVSGLVWAGDETGGFSWHSWAEVELDGRWHRVDPSWGETVANATHIALGVNGASDWLVLLGDLEISIEDVETAPAEPLQ